LTQASSDADASSARGVPGSGPIDWGCVKGQSRAVRGRHSVQDECVFILSGEVTLIHAHGETVLTAGMFAGFAHGGTSHQLVNRSYADHARGPAVLRRDALARAQTHRRPLRRRLCEAPRRSARRMHEKPGRAIAAHLQPLAGRRACPLARLPNWSLGRVHLYAWVLTSRLSLRILRHAEASSPHRD